MTTLRILGEFTLTMACLVVAAVTSPFWLGWLMWQWHRQRREFLRGRCT